MGFKGNAKELFRNFDKDGTGTVSFSEFAPEYYAAFEEFFAYVKTVVEDDRLVTAWKVLFKELNSIYFVKLSLCGRMRVFCWWKSLFLRVFCWCFLSFPSSDPIQHPPPQKMSRRMSSSRPARRLVTRRMPRSPTQSRSSNGSTPTAAGC